MKIKLSDLESNISSDDEKRNLKGFGPGPDCISEERKLESEKTVLIVMEKELLLTATEIEEKIKKVVGASSYIVNNISKAKEVLNKSKIDLIILDNKVDNEIWSNHKISVIVLVNKQKEVLELVGNAQDKKRCVIVKQGGIIDVAKLVNKVKFLI